MLALSPAFPQTCKCMHSTVKSFSPVAHAYYLLSRCSYWGPKFEVAMTLSSAPRYPITTLAVLEAFYSVILRSNLTFERQHQIKLPKRLFRSLGKSDATRNVNSDSFPLLRFLWRGAQDQF